MSDHKTFEPPSRCGSGPGCACSRCSFADGYEVGRQEAMGMHLATIDYLIGARPPRSTPTIRALRAVAEALDKVAVEAFGADDWDSFKQAARRSVAKSDPAAQREPEDLN